MTTAPQQEAARSLTRRFGTTDALRRGNATLHNFLEPALLVAYAPALGMDVVFLSNFMAFGLGTILEIPTGLWADRFGWAKSLRYSAFLSLFSYLFLFLVFVFAQTGHVPLAWTALVLQAGFFATGGAFFSGAFDAAYDKWYHDRIAILGLSRTEAPRLFMSSFGYGLSIRVLVPLLGAFAGYGVSRWNGDLASVSLFVPGSLIALIVTFRTLVAMRIERDVGSVHNETTAGKSLAETMYDSVVSYVGSLRLSATYTYADLVDLCALYVGAEALTFIKLSSGDISQTAFWTKAGAFTAAVACLSATLNRVAMPRLTQISDTGSLRWLGPGAVGLIVAPVLALTLVLDGVGSTTKLVVALFSILFLRLVQAAVASEVKSVAPTIIPEQYRATWFSSGILMGGATFSVLSLLAVATGIARIGPLFIVAGLGLGGLILATVNFRQRHNVENYRRPSIRRLYICVAVGAAVCLVGTIGSLALRFVNHVNTRAEHAQVEMVERIRADLDERLRRDVFLVSGPASPPADANAHEVLARIERLSGVECIQVDGIKDCPEGKEAAAWIVPGGQLARILVSREASETATRYIAGSVGGIFASMALVIVLLVVGVRAVVNNLSRELSSAALNRFNERKPHQKDSYRYDEPYQIAQAFAKAAQDLAELERERVRGHVLKGMGHDLARSLRLLQLGIEKMRAAPTATAKLGVLQRLEDHHLPELCASAQGMLHDLINMDARTLQVGETSVDRIFARALENVQYLRPKSDVKVRWKWVGSQALRGDSFKLMRAITNVVENAFDAMHNRGQLQVASRATQRQGKPFLEVSIRNSGPHIAEDAPGKIFEMSYTRDKKNGSGIGLAVAKAFVEMHGGEIWYQNLRLNAGGGVEFTILLPNGAAPC